MSQVNTSQPAPVNTASTKPHQAVNLPSVKNTKKAFQDLIDAVKVLAVDPKFGTTLDENEKIPALEEDIKILREQQKVDEKAWQQSLKTYNTERDSWITERKQLQDGWVAETEGLQAQSTKLQEELAEKEKSIKTLKDREAKQLKTIKDLEESSLAQKKDLESKSKQIQGIAKVKDSEKQKSKDLMRELENQREEFAQVNANLEVMKKEYTLLQRRAKEDAQKLEVAAQLTTTLKDDQQAVEDLDKLWLAVSNTVCSTFLRDVTCDESQMQKFQGRVASFDWGKKFPLPLTNSEAAKQMRCVAVLASLARSFADYLFQPTYLLPAESGIRDLLFRQAKNHEAKESAIRASLLALLPHEQEAASSRAVDKACEAVMKLIHGLLPPTEESEFQSRIKEVAKEACEVWKEIRSFEDAMEPSFEIQHYTDWPWQQFVFQSNQPVLGDFNPQKDRAAFAIFPRLYSFYEGEKMPETRGVLFMRSQWKAAKEEEDNHEPSPDLERSGSIRPKLPKLRRTSTGMKSHQTAPQTPTFLGPSPQGLGGSSPE